jgi:hypothetical protein
MPVFWRDAILHSQGTRLKVQAERMQQQQQG